jgi:hypothetical protein
MEGGSKKEKTMMFTDLELDELIEATNRAMLEMRTRLDKVKRRNILERRIARLLTIIAKLRRMRDGPR